MARPPRRQSRPTRDLRLLLDMLAANDVGRRPELRKEHPTRVTVLPASPRVKNFGFWRLHCHVPAK